MQSTSKPSCPLLLPSFSSSLSSSQNKTTGSKNYCCSLSNNNLIINSFISPNNHNDNHSSIGLLQDSIRKPIRRFKVFCDPPSSIIDSCPQASSSTTTSATTTIKNDNKMNSSTRLSSKTINNFNEQVLIKNDKENLVSNCLKWLDGNHKTNGRRGRSHGNPSRVLMNKPIPEIKSWSIDHQDSVLMIDEIQDQKMKSIINNKDEDDDKKTFTRFESNMKLRSKDHHHASSINLNQYDWSPPTTRVDCSIQISGIETLVARLEVLDTGDHSDFNPGPIILENNESIILEPLPPDSTCPGAPRISSSETMPSLYDYDDDDDLINNEQIRRTDKITWSGTQSHPMSPLAEVTEAYTGLQGGWKAANERTHEEPDYQMSHEQDDDDDRQLIDNSSSSTPITDLLGHPESVYEAVEWITNDHHRTTSQQRFNNRHRIFNSSGLGLDSVRTTKRSLCLSNSKGPMRI